MSSPGAMRWRTNGRLSRFSPLTALSRAPPNGCPLRHQTNGTSFVLTGGGADDLGLASLRTGGAISPDTSYRVSGKYFYRDQMVLANGDDAKDSSRIGRTGFRMDTSQGTNEFTFE